MTEVVAALIWQGDTFMICQRPAHKALIQKRNSNNKNLVSDLETRFFI